MDVAAAEAAAAAARRRAASGRREKALNACLLFTNVFYIATAIAILSIGMAVLQEHVDDLKANVFNDYEVLGKPQPTPCSLPTPDAMRLLQSLGAVPDGGLEASVLEPDYISWIASIRDNMCFRKIIGVPNPSFGASDALCGNGSSGAYADSADYAEELLALSGILDDASFSPVDADLAASDLSVKLELFNSRACLTKREAGVDPFYQQLRSYGDLKVRAMRAYLAAMPSFFHYAQVQTTCWHSAVADPFTTLCMHACHVEAELGRAAGDLRFLVRDGDAYNPRMPEWADGVPLELPKVLYRLLALSVVGHYDRYYNEGRCFRNADSGGAPYSNASSFCAAVLSTAELHEAVSDPADPMGSYGAQQQVVHDDYGCARGSSPPPPAPPNTHAAADAHAPDDDLAALYHAVCASTLEYGLFEQGRLFGIQDPTGPFVVDNRGAPDALALLFGSVIYDLLYVHQNVGERFKEPKARLELYMAYRLAGTAVWGTLAAAVCGYMLFRAIVPTLVVATRCLGLKGLDGRPVTLRRPQADVPVYLAIFSTLLAGYWMIYIDPATQSHYPRTTDCSEFLGSDTQISTSVYVTTWSKRRFDRAGEQQLGILLWVLAFLFAFHQTVGKFCTDRTRDAPRDARDARDALRPCSGNSRGSSTPVMLEANVAHLCNGFLYCVNGDLKEPARLIVRALAQHGQPLPKTLLDTVTAANKPTLEFWIEALGKGVSVAERARFGSNFANLVNLETEQDFREILASTPWTREELDGALAEAVRLQRAIPAQLLITLPPHECARLPDGVRNAWLEAITEYVFRPDGAGAQAVCARLMSDQAKLPLAAERNNKRNAGAAGLALPLSAPPPLRRVRSA